MDAIFFPRNDYPNNVEVCAHRFGKSMTYTDSTDTLYGANTYVPYMTMAKARNIKTSCFLRLKVAVDDLGGIVTSDYMNNKIWLDAYANVSEIEEKIIHGEVITEEEWNSAYNNSILPNFYNYTGKKPVALSYAYGNESFQDYVTQFLGARGEEAVGETDYGIGKGYPSDKPYSFSRYKNKHSTTRWYDQAKWKIASQWREDTGNTGYPPESVYLSEEYAHFYNEELELLSSKIDETILNGGWMNNFVHWHHYFQNDRWQYAESYLDVLSQKNANDEIYFSGYGEAVAYLVYRQLITKAVMYSPNANHSTHLVIRLEARNTLNVDTDLLQVPISVKFSTLGTPLAGQAIRSDCNLISLGSNQYIVEIPYSDFPVAIIEKVSI